MLVIAPAIISAASVSVRRVGYLGVFVDLPAPWIIGFVVAVMGLVACLATRQPVALAGIITFMEVDGLVPVVAANRSG